MTWNWFRHHAGVNCIPLLTSRCQGWTDDQVRQQGWLSDGRQVLEVTLGDVMPGGEPPLLKHRKQLSREQAIKLWGQKQQEGWRACPPQWIPQKPLRA